jgi:hypothetical protein
MAKPKPRCRVPAGWRLVAKDAQAVIVQGVVSTPNGEGGRFSERRWRYCLSDRGRFQMLVTNAGAEGGYQDIVRVIALELSGSYVAYDTNDSLGGGRYGTVDGDVHLQNLATGRSAARGGTCCFDPPTVVLSATGLALWQVENENTTPQGTPSSWSWSVQVLDDRMLKSSTLDSAPAIPSPGGGITTIPAFANLQLQECLAGCSPLGVVSAWWTHDGIWHSQRVGYATRG